MAPFRVNITSTYPYTFKFGVFCFGDKNDNLKATVIGPGQLFGIYLQFVFHICR